MPKRRRSVAGLVGLGLLTASLIPDGPAQALDAHPPDEWRVPQHRTAGPAAQPGAVSAYSDPADFLGFELTPADCAGMQRRNQAVGGLLGGLAGGLIGSGIGKGSGKTAATIGGALLGALGGALLGNKVAEAGETCLPEPEYGLGPAEERPASPFDLY